MYMDTNWANMFVSRVPARWSRKAGVNPSSQWCWEPGLWSLRTTMRTAAMTPPCLPAPVPRPSRWSSTNAVRLKRGRSSRGRGLAEGALTFSLPSVTKRILTDNSLCSLSSQMRLPGVHRLSRWEGALRHESWNGQVAKGEAPGTLYSLLFQKTVFSRLTRPTL